MWLLVIACCYWTLGAVIPDDERGPILRRPPDLALAIPPLPMYARANLDRVCLDRLAETSALVHAPDDELLPALAELVEIGRTHGADCRVAVDDAIVSIADARTLTTFTLRSSSYWMLAGRAATTLDRRAAGFRNAASFAWQLAAHHVRRGARAGAAFPLDAWIDAGDALVGVGLLPHALDAYENALRASRARELTREQAQHIAGALEQLPGERAAALRARITL